MTPIIRALLAFVASVFHSRHPCSWRLWRCDTNWRSLNVTEHPAAQWTARQLVEAFSWETAPKYLLRGRDAVYGARFQ